MSMDYSKEKLKVLITMARDLKGEERNKICSPRVIGSLAVNGCSNDSIQVTETQQETFNPVFMEEMLVRNRATYMGFILFSIVFYAQNLYLVLL